NVGIGTTSPAQTFSVGGAAYITGNVGIGTNSTNRTGNVAGYQSLTMEASQLNRGSYLELVGNQQSTADSEINFFNQNGSGTYYDYANIAVQRDGSNNDAGKMSFGTEPTGGSLTSRMTILSTGNVGIGTTNPQTALMIASSSDTAFTGTGRGSLEITTTDDNSGSFYRSISFGRLVSGPIAKIGVQRTGTGSYMLLGTSNAYASGITNTAMTIDPSGNVGIGTTNPQNVLGIAQAANTAGLSLYGNVNGVSTSQYLALNAQYSPTDTTGRGQIRFIRDGNSSANGSDISFLTQNDSGSTLSEAMRINYNGNIGIGTGSPTGLLQVGDSGQSSEASIRLRNSVSNPTFLDVAGNDGSNSFGLGTQPAGAFLIGNNLNNEVRFFQNGTDFFHSSGGGQVYFSSSIGTGTGGNYLCIDTSDYQILRGNGSTCTASSLRFKQNVADLNYSLSDILKLRPVSFEYKPETNIGPGTKLGFIAEEMANVIPEAVTYDKQGQIFGIDYEMLTSVLAKGEQDLASTTAFIKNNYPATAGTVLTIDSNGNVVIGTSTPSTAFSVFSNVTGGGVASFTDANASCVIDPTNASLTCSSDESLKKDITPLDATSTLSKLMDLQAVQYHWNGEDSSQPDHSGFITQDVAQIFPEMVTTLGNGKKALAYSQMIPVLVDAVQAENVKIDSIDERLTHVEELLASSTPSGSSFSVSDAVTQMFSSLETAGLKFASGTAYLANAVIANLTIGSQSSPTGVTLYDTVTKLPYCLSIANGIATSTAGNCGSTIAATSTPAVSTTATTSPAITVVGDNPA